MKPSLLAQSQITIHKSSAPGLSTDMLRQIEDQIQLSISNLDFYFSMLDEMEDTTLLSKVRQYIKSAKIPLRQLTVLNQQLHALQGHFSDERADFFSIRTLIDNGLSNNALFFQEKDIKADVSWNGCDHIRLKAPPKLSTQLVSQMLYFFYKIASGHDVLKLVVKAKKNADDLSIYMYVSKKNLEQLMGSFAYQSLKFLAKHIDAKIGIEKGAAIQAMRLRFELPK